MRRSLPEWAWRADGEADRWVGTLQPTPLSYRYTVEISYEPSARPKVRILDPMLEDRGTRLPHTFPDGADDICLHMPDEWADFMRIPDTIIPWAAEWLYHYEIWALTGEWCGGGHQASRPQQ